MGSSPNISNENGNENVFHSADAGTGNYVQSDDSEDNDYAYEGYHRIPIDQTEEIDAENHCGIEDSHVAQSSQHILIETNLDDAVNESVNFEKNVFKSPRPKELEIELDTSKAEQIMAAMASITLPLSAIPEWAHEISENKWKETLLHRIRQQKERSSSLEGEHLKNQ